VPIIPDYLEQLDNESQQAAAADAQQALATDAPPPAAATDDGGGGGGQTTAAPEDACQKQRGENVLVGAMFASKAFVQLLHQPVRRPDDQQVRSALPVWCPLAGGVCRSAGGGREYCRVLQLRAESATRSPCSPASPSCLARR